ncbi:MAG: hypothetical protein K8I60_06205 [Anaerolineae bacterium]|nr:hypothetical protein [Anaerolineae bacterium]
MDFFRKLFSGDGRPGGEQDSGMYFYVQPRNCEEIVRVRVDTKHEANQTDDGTHYIRKFVRAQDWRCGQTVELEIFLDADKRYQDATISGGTLVTEAEYTAWMNAHS